MRLIIDYRRGDGRAADEWSVGLHVGQVGGLAIWPHETNFLSITGEEMAELLMSGQLAFMLAKSVV
jgi:hypothetical protein